MTFSERVRLLERHGFTTVKEKGSIRYAGKPGWPRLIRVDFPGSREVSCIQAGSEEQPGAGDALPRA